eukprot:EG_transcript_26084
MAQEFWRRQAAAPDAGLPWRTFWAALRAEWPSVGPETQSLWRYVLRMEADGTEGGEGAGGVSLPALETLTAYFGPDFGLAAGEMSAVLDWPAFHGAVSVAEAYATLGGRPPGTWLVGFGPPGEYLVAFVDEEEEILSRRVQVTHDPPLGPRYRVEGTSAASRPHASLARCVAASPLNLDLDAAVERFGPLRPLPAPRPSAPPTPTLRPGPPPALVPLPTPAAAVVPAPLPTPTPAPRPAPVPAA